jgi:hypothetical protein
MQVSTIQPCFRLLAETPGAAHGDLWDRLTPDSALGVL